MLDTRRRSLGAVVVLAFFGILTLVHGAALPFFGLGVFCALLVVAEDDNWGWPLAASIRVMARSRALRRAVPLLIGGFCATAGSAISIRRRLARFLAKRTKFFERIQKIIDLHVLLTQKFLLTPVLRGAEASAPA